MLGKESRRRSGQQRMRWVESVTDSMDMNLSKLWEIMNDQGGWLLQSVGHKESDTTERLKKTTRGYNCKMFTIKGSRLWRGLLSSYYSPLLLFQNSSPLSFKIVTDGLKKNNVCRFEDLYKVRYVSRMV